MSNRPTRLGLLGTGFMAQLAHLPCFAAAPNSQITAIASHRPQLAARLAAQYGIPKVYAGYADLIADPEIDAILCIQPFHNHYELGSQILGAGKALFTEKPMVTRLEDGKALVALAEREGLVYGVGFMKRFDPGVQLARERVQALLELGQLGALQFVEAHCYLGDWLQGAGAPLPSTEPASYPASARTYPGHVPAARAAAFDYLLEVYSHNLNLVRYLLPHEQFKCLSAAMGGPETWAITLAAGPVLFSLHGSRSAAHTWDEVTTLVFERGKVSLRTPAPMNWQAAAEVTIYRHAKAASSEERLSPPPEWAFARQAQAFVAAVQGAAPFAASGRDCLADLEIIEDVFRLLPPLAVPVTG